MNLETKITIYKFTPQLFTLTRIFAHQWTQKLIQNLSFNFNQYGNSQTNNFQSKSFKRWQT